MKKASLLLVLVAMGSCGLLRAQSFEVKNDNLRVTSLNGFWRFHPGDNPAWADPKFNDSGWPLLRSDKDWSTQGYPGYAGTGWYRFEVTVPAGMNAAAIYLPRIMTCYQVFADGRLIGTYGKMPPNPEPYAGGRYHLYELPAGNGRARTVSIAVRVWHWPGWVRFFNGGPSRGDGLVGDRSEIDRREALESASLHWSLTSYQTLALLQTLAGLGTLALFVLRRKEREYLWFSLTMMLSAAFGFVNAAGYEHVWNVAQRDMVLDVLQVSAGLALIAFYAALLQPRRGKRYQLAVACSAVSVLLTPILYLSGALVSIWIVNIIWAILWLPFHVWVVSMVVERARRHSHDAGLLVAPVVLSTSANLFASGAWITYTLGWQHRIMLRVALTETPFPINLVQVTDALFLLAVIAILILRFSRTRSLEERLKSEVQAARQVQQYLIPEHLPATPGLNIDSEYRPAREVGGDFFQVLPPEVDGSVLIVLGDVAGKGMEAGMLASLMVGAIHTAVAFTGDPKRLVGMLNERMCGRGQATCLALRIERDGRAILANAGHLPPYLNGKELPMEGALPLGTIHGIDFPVLRFKLCEGDILMLMTDGVVEAQNAEGRLFGFERIGAMLQQGMGGGAVATAAQEFGQEDDITVLTVVRAGAEIAELAELGELAGLRS